MITEYLTEITLISLGVLCLINLAVISMVFYLKSRVRKNDKGIVFNLKLIRDVTALMQRVSQDQTDADLSIIRLMSQLEEKVDYLKVRVNYKNNNL